MDYVAFRLRRLRVRESDEITIPTFRINSNRLRKALEEWRVQRSLVTPGSLLQSVRVGMHMANDAIWRVAELHHISYTKAACLAIDLGIAIPMARGKAGR